MRTVEKTDGRIMRDNDTTGSTDDATIDAGNAAGNASRARGTGDQVTDGALAHETVTNDAVAGEPVIKNDETMSDAAESTQSLGSSDNSDNSDNSGSPGRSGSTGSSSDDPDTFSNEYGEAQPAYDEHGDTDIELGVDAADSRTDGESNPPIAEVTRKPDTP